MIRTVKVLGMLVNSSKDKPLGRVDCFCQTSIDSKELNGLRQPRSI